VNVLINDRLFMGGRPLKCLVEEPGRKNLIATLRVTRESGGAQPVKITIPELGREIAGWAGQFSTGELPAGRYALDVQIENRTVAHHGFEVMNAGQFDSLLTMFASTAPSAPRTQFSGAAELRPRWERLWNRINQFVGQSRLPIRFEAAEFKDVAGLENTCVEAFDLTGFHILRFLVDEVFWDGVILVDRIAGAPLLSFRFTVYAKTPVPIGAGRESEWTALRRALNRFGYQTEIKWASKRTEAILDLSLGRAPG
jgi:hypothetical protein